MKKFLAEFKEFALKGNVMDMAIGVIIGAAFGNIVTALTENFINPLIAVIFGGNSEDGLQIGGQFAVRGVSFNYGAFLSAVVNFLIIALVLFIMLKAINTAAEKAKKLALKKAADDAKENPPEDPADIKLLKEMVAILKEQNPDAAKKAEEKLAAEAK